MNKQQTELWSLLTANDVIDAFCEIDPESNYIEPLACALRDGNNIRIARMTTGIVKTWLEMQTELFALEKQAKPS